MGGSANHVVGGDFNLDLKNPRKGETEIVKNIDDEFFAFKNIIRKGSTTHCNHLNKTPSCIDHILVKNVKVQKFQLRDLPSCIDDNHKGLYGFLPIPKINDDFVKIVLSRRPVSKLKIFKTLITCWPVFLTNMNDKTITDQIRAEKNIKYLSAIINILEPEKARLTPIRKYHAAMAPDTNEWQRRVILLKSWRNEVLKNNKNFAKLCTDTGKNKNNKFRKQFLKKMKIESNNENKKDNLLNEIDLSLRQAKFNFRKLYRRDKRILMMDMFEDRCIDMKSIWNTVNKLTDNQLAFYNASELTANDLADNIYNLQHKNESHVPFLDLTADKIFEDTKRLPVKKFVLKVPPWTGKTNSTSTRKCVLAAKKNTRGADGVNGRFLDAMPICYQPIIQHLFQTSYEKGIFFRSFRENKIICIDKSADAKDRNNPKLKRPITIQDALGGCLERCCAAQFLEYCEKNGGLMDWQHGFRPCRSCSTAFATFVRTINTRRQKCLFGRQQRIWVS
jgi:hypothetical protein